MAEDRRQLNERIDSEYQQLCSALGITHSPDKPGGDAPELHGGDFQDNDDEEAEEERRQRWFLAKDWIQQERFNIQEAFTNQTKKIQRDFQAFMDQLDAEFVVERQKIFHQQPDTPSSIKSSPQQRRMKAKQLDRQFKNNA
ncbi:hypothetical protein PINS_up022624 [Pythium insidiosum]|nr:hypothetical protein PINS_up022624 [Pythium insidiosum]